MSVCFFLPFVFWGCSQLTDKKSTEAEQEIPTSQNAVKTSADSDTPITENIIDDAAANVIILDFDLEAEKTKFRKIISESEFSEKVKNEAKHYIDSFDFSKTRTTHDFVELFVKGLFDHLPQGVESKLKKQIETVGQPKESSAENQQELIDSIRKQLLDEIKNQPVTSAENTPASAPQNQSVPTVGPVLLEKKEDDAFQKRLQELKDSILNPTVPVTLHTDNEPGYNWILYHVEVDNCFPHFHDVLPETYGPKFPICNAATEGKNHCASQEGEESSRCDQCEKNLYYCYKN